MDGTNLFIDAGEKMIRFRESKGTSQGGRATGEVALAGEDKIFSESFRRRSRSKKFLNRGQERAIKSKSIEESVKAAKESREKRILFPGFNKSTRKRRIQEGSQREEDVVIRCVN